jgi:hypothetical protein
VLWTEFLRWSPQGADWAGRDRFVLSGGHGSMLLYSLLHLAGFPVSLDDLKQFRQLHSKTPGHPEYGETVGVETTTGPLGQGFANAVGIAIGAHMEAARFQNPLLLTRVFVTVGDGDLMEGISYEAATLAGHLQLGNLVCLFDDNGITIEGHTDLATSEDIGKRFEARAGRCSTSTATTPSRSARRSPAPAAGHRQAAADLLQDDDRQGQPEQGEHARRARRAARQGRGRGDQEGARHAGRGLLRRPRGEGRVRRRRRSATSSCASAGTPP